ncbi:hypothetical protein QEN19_002982 [Hanseniaspora menglaensis]
MLDFESKYKLFSIDKSKDFDLVESFLPLPNPKIYTLLILDSSFNPPHKGHMKMINKALNKYKNVKKIGILLQLSINNVDKRMLPASPSKRLHMMSLFASEISKDNQIPIFTGLSKYGKFSEKLPPINTNFRHMFYDKPDFVFLLGFDTLERLFMPKYYYPDNVEKALSDLFKNSSIHCLTRGMDYKTQKQWVINNVPLIFQHRINIELNDDQESCNISSSNIRASETYSQCTKQVEIYIKENQKDIFQ